MPIILELRDRAEHSGQPLVHPRAESVVLAHLFGIVKNLSHPLVFNQWLGAIHGFSATLPRKWQFCFWETQPRPINVVEGSTEVDIMVDSPTHLVFIEVKMDAPPSPSSSSDPFRNQIVRNLDVGYRRAIEEQKEFLLVYLTPELREPAIVKRIKSGYADFPCNADAPKDQILGSLTWSSWAALGDTMASAYNGGSLLPPEELFLLDGLAYLAKKRLWENSLDDRKVFYVDKLYRSLRKTDSPFVAYADQRPERYEDWKHKPWTPEALVNVLQHLRWQDKLLLKHLAENGGWQYQGNLLNSVPVLVGKDPSALAGLKRSINGTCRQSDRMPVLAEGQGNKDERVHEINPALGELRGLVIETANAFDEDTLIPATSGTFDTE